MYIDRRDPDHYYDAPFDLEAYLDRIEEAREDKEKERKCEDE